MNMHAWRPADKPNPGRNSTRRLSGRDSGAAGRRLTGRRLNSVLGSAQPWRINICLWFTCNVGWDGEVDGMGWNEDQCLFVVFGKSVAGFHCLLIFVCWDCSNFDPMKPLQGYGMISLQERHWSDLGHRGGWAAAAQSPKR